MEQVQLSEPSKDLHWYVTKGLQCRLYMHVSLYILFVPVFINYVQICVWCKYRQLWFLRSIFDKIWHKGSYLWYCQKTELFALRTVTLKYISLWSGFWCVVNVLKIVYNSVMIVRVFDSFAEFLNWQLLCLWSLKYSNNKFDFIKICYHVNDFQTCGVLRY
jgi:hypothetical protein